MCINDTINLLVPRPESTHSWLPLPLSSLATIETGKLFPLSSWVARLHFAVFQQVHEWALAKKNTGRGMLTTFWAGSKSFYKTLHAVSIPSSSCHMWSGDTSSGGQCGLRWSYKVEGTWVPEWLHGSSLPIHPHHTVMWVRNKPLVLSHLDSVGFVTVAGL